MKKISEKGKFIMSINYDNFSELSKNELLDRIQINLEEHESLKYLLDNLHGISWEFDVVQNIFTFISSNTKEILGYELSAWTNFQSWIDMIHVEDRERISSYCRIQTKEGNNHSMEYRMIKKSGEEIWILDIVTLVKNEDKKVVKLIGFFLDITDKKVSEVKLKEEHAFYQKVINGISDPIMVINADYSVDVMNEEVRKTLEGRTFMDPSSPKCYEISHFRDTPCEGVDDPCPLKDVLESSKPTKVMHNHRNEDGSDCFVELAASPLFDSSNKCVGIIETARDVTAYVQLTKKLKYEATHDSLTGLANRALFMDRLNQNVLDSQRNKTSFTLFFMDLDHFKEVNDTYGHDMGDKVLQEVSKKFGACIRGNDSLFRLAGDEFTVILKDIVEDEDIKKIAQKFVDIFEDGLSVDGTKLRLSVSIGIRIFSKDDTADILLKYADKAMYKAKEKGKNTYAFAR